MVCKVFLTKCLPESDQEEIIRKLKSKDIFQNNCHRCENVMLGNIVKKQMKSKKQKKRKQT